MDFSELRGRILRFACKDTKTFENQTKNLKNMATTRRKTKTRSASKTRRGTKKTTRKTTRKRRKSCR